MNKPLQATTSTLLHENKNTKLDCNANTQLYSRELNAATSITAQRTMWLNL